MALRWFKEPKHVRGDSERAELFWPGEKKTQGILYQYLGIPDGRKKERKQRQLSSVVSSDNRQWAQIEIQEFVLKQKKKLLLFMLFVLGFLICLL